MIEKDRLLAITDGIIVIAATLMIMQLHIPDEISIEAVSKQFPILFAYIVSYMHHGTSTMMHVLMLYFSITDCCLLTRCGCSS